MTSTSNHLPPKRTRCHSPALKAIRDRNSHPSFLNLQVNLGGQSRTGHVLCTLGKGQVSGDFVSAQVA